MHVHLPKPLHGWREFVGEVGIIVIGVLIALGAQQIAEAIHKRTQARVLSHKLHNQSADNRHVAIYDINTLVDDMNALETDIADLGPGGDPRALKQIARADLFAMSDSTWIAARNSDLIGVLPSRDVGNYEKLSITSDFLESRWARVDEDTQRAQAEIATQMLSPGGAAEHRQLLLKLEELRASETLLLDTLRFFERINDQALRGEEIDSVKDIVARAESKRATELKTAR